MFSKIFIGRLVFAMVISLIIVIAGLVCPKGLMAAQYPMITAGADSNDIKNAIFKKKVIVHRSKNAFLTQK